MLERTPLYGIHKEVGAKFVPFAGWEMPVQFSSILDEAKEVRRGVGVFDVSHMGRIFVEGSQAEEFLEYLTTNSVKRLNPGDVQYSLILNERGGTVDDITVYRFGDNRFMLCVNAANRQKVLRHMENLAKGYDVKIEDRSKELVQLAVQGPKAVEVVEKFFPGVGELKFYTFKTFGDTVVSRTGYTGEDGFEIYIPVEEGKKLYKDLLEEGVKPCGLGARDVLRIEAGYPLYGHELSEELDPREANLKRFIDLQKEFFGKEGLFSRGEPKRRLLGLVLEQRRITRQGDKVFIENTPVGEVTSGTFSPNLGKSIALAFLQRGIEKGSTVEVEIRGKRLKAEVVSPRFIDNTPRRRKK